MVEEYQHEAKKTFAQGKFMYKKAYNQFNMAIRYCEKLEMTPENKHTLATLYGNCALIQLKKENFRTCLKDCNAALALDVRVLVYDQSTYHQPSYKKVLYRKAKALAGLCKYADAVDFCDKVLEQDPENVYAIRLREDCEKHIEKAEKLNEEITRKVCTKFQMKMKMIMINVDD